MHQWKRRQVLELMLAGTTATLWPTRALFAQGAAPTLVRAKKEALVIGNSRYKQSPLKNPPNDAKSMAEELQKVGFNVTLGLELTRAQMRAMIGAYGRTLAESKAVGLFYFAGHGAQLAWRNYLIPIDAEIDSVQELREEGVDVNSLIDSIRKAGNPMNLIVLDACRDNPFGSIARLEQKGLSQLDAPPGTLLAYATAPGNTAIDGEGEHGLYTEHLLKEIRVPDAKVEDVFKRVRLRVRRRSNGQQIPWESTSLEHDFWFVPPQEIRKLAEEEREREFRKELALWERIQSSEKPDPLEEYLRNYPSGHFTELAQLHIDRILARQGEKKIAIVSPPENPYTKGTAIADTAFKVGDLYHYRRFDLLTGLQAKPINQRVTDITATEVVFNGGARVTDLLGNTLRTGRGAVWSPNQTVPTEFAVGKRWMTRFHMTNPKGLEGIVELELRIATREQVTVPAGTFNAFRVEARGWRSGEGSTVAWDWKTWYAPDQCRRPIAGEVLNRARNNQITASMRTELVAFKQA